MCKMHESFHPKAQIREYYEKQVKVRGAKAPPYQSHRTAEPTGCNGFSDFKAGVT